MRLDGQIAVITGASRGIGAGLATEFAARGMKLGLCSRTAPVRGGSETVVADELDVRDLAALERFADRVAETLGPIDLWINNAGVLDPIGPVRDIDPAEFARHIEVNVLGVLHGSRWYCQHRRRAGGGGVLVNISSGAGRKGYYGWGAYCAGKAAVDRLSECIALEEKDAGLRVHAVAPGIIDTYMQEQIRAATPEEFAEVGRFVRLKEEGKFSSIEWVAARLLDLVFDPAHQTDDVLVGLPLEHPA
jgi:NAD(P)-dependent dehydrogenase (short-subunit alcohol dehydrogenase family)